MSSATQKFVVPKAFVWRRLHSLMGLWLVIYLIEHLVTNSQAALWIGNDGNEFIKLVNFIQSLPYLKVIEIVLLGIPFALHMFWGVRYLFTAKSNVRKSEGNRPSLGKYGRNRAYSWQRITSWILLIGIIGHVVQMRFIDYPVKVSLGQNKLYLVRLNFDKGLYTLAPRMGFYLFNREEILQSALGEKSLQNSPLKVDSSFFDPEVGEEIAYLQQRDQEERWISLLQKFSLTNDQVIAAAPSAGMAMLLNVRDTFKSPWMIAFYTIFVLAAAFHACNGLWTFLLTWGVLLSMKSQKSMVSVCMGAGFILSLLGLASIWGTYWVNLRQ